MKLVARLTPFHCTADVGAKPLPLTSSSKSGALACAAADVLLMLLEIGGGLITVTVICSSAFDTPSDRRTVSSYVPAPCVAVGVQLNSPVLPLIVAPAGAFGRENVRTFAGSSASVAVAVNVSAFPQTTDLSPTEPRTGAALASVMVIVTCRSPLSAGAPSSVARTANAYVAGPCASVGVQVKAPVAASIVAPAGPPTRLKAIALPSGSVAAAVNTTDEPSAPVRSAIASIAGASFTDLTAIET